MRINIYAEEISGETQLVTKTVTDEKFGERTFYGIRVWLHSPSQLHSDPEDDDRSAITFWVPWTKVGGHDFDFMAGLFAAMADELVKAIRHDDHNKGKREDNVNG